MASSRHSGERFVSPQSYTPKHLADKILTSRGAIEGERKQVTVLFTDVSGFTAISERLDPEDVHAIMDQTFDVILAAVHRYEGTINQFLGDGVMALFGAPIAHEDHPHRALRAALAIQEGMRRLRDQVQRTHGVEFRLRIGINTGLVVVGAIGRDLRMDYTAVGDTTNLAARLLAVAQPGQIVISEHCRQLTEGFFVVEDLGEFTVKGKTAPVHAFAVTNEIRGRTRLEVSKERGLTPLSGRQMELERLEAAHRRADDGHGSTVLMRGEPGVGKSRLLYEFFRRIGNRGALELETSCVSHGRSMPYHPVLALLRAGLGISEDMVEDDVLAVLRRTLRAARLDEPESEALVTHFLGLPSAKEFLIRLEAAQLKSRTFHVLTQMLLRASQRRLVIVVVENIHWADESSLEFFRTLVEAVPGHRILLILSTRPTFSASWLENPMVDSILLQGLPAADLGGMIRSLLGADDISEALLHLLVEKSDGNPLYVEEIVRQLRETSALVVESGRARLEGSRVAVPETIHDIIAARIDRLSETLKGTLQAAAVVGRQFPVELLSLILQSDGEIIRQLEDLHELDFIFPTQREPQLIYVFKHALTQEVVYNSLLERRRRTYHASIGAGLETIYQDSIDEIVEVLAYHYGRSADAEKAVDYSIRAGEKAQRRWAGTEALAHFDAALKRVESMEATEANRLRRMDAVIKQAEIKFALGRHADQANALEQIRALVDTTADPVRRAGWYYWTGFLHSITGSRPEVPIAYCREALAIADGANLEDIKSFAECCLTHVYAMAGDLQPAVAAGERALPAFEARGNVWWACRTLWGLSIALIYLGEWQRSLDYCRRALEHGKTVNDRRIKVVSWWRMGWTHIQRGDVEAGVRCCQEALELAPSPVDAAMASAAQGYGLVRLGEVQAGTTQLAEAVAWFHQSNLHLTRSSFGVWLGNAYLLQGDVGRARVVLEEVLSTSEKLGYRHLQGIAHRVLGDLFVEHDPSVADGHLQIAMRILSEVGARNEYAKALITKAELGRRSGDVVTARGLLEEAGGIFAALGTLDEPRRVRAALTTLASTSSP